MEWFLINDSNVGAIERGIKTDLNRPRRLAIDLQMAAQRFDRGRCKLVDFVSSLLAYFLHPFTGWPRLGGPDDFSGELCVADGLWPPKPFQCFPHTAQGRQNKSARNDVEGAMASLHYNGGARRCRCRCPTATRGAACCRPALLWDELYADCGELGLPVRRAPRPDARRLHPHPLPHPSQILGQPQPAARSPPARPTRLFLHVRAPSLPSWAWLPHMKQLTRWCRTGGLSTSPSRASPTSCTTPGTMPRRLL